MRRIVIWIVGLALLSLIYVGAIHFKADDIEIELKDRSNLALHEKNISWAKVTINGRDAILNGTAPDIASVEEAKKAIMSVWGIRLVECRCQIPEARSTTATQSSPNLEEEQCQKKINDLLKKHSIEFASGSSKISSDSFSLLQKLITITQNCPGKQIKIAGHTDNIGNSGKNNTLSLARAEAVLDYFQNSGVMKDRLKAVGYGDSSPVVSNDTKEGRKRNRRIEFHITP